jgi:hypothetical protein
MIDADQHQWRLKRDRTERVGRHAVYMAFGCFDCNDRHAASEAAQRGAKFIGRDQLIPC